MDRPSPPPRTVVDEAVESIRAAMVELQRCTARVQTMLGGPKYDERLASHLAWVTKQMSGNLDAMRKQEAAERKRWEGMTRAEEVEIVKSWLDELPEAERAELRAHLAVAVGGGLLS